MLPLLSVMIYFNLAVLNAKESKYLVLLMLNVH